MTRDVNENETGNAGDPVTAEDAENDDIAYTITGGADMDKFGIGLSTGQITVGDSGTSLNFEGDQTSYELVVTATDPFAESDSTTVTLTVNDVNEEPDLTVGDLEEDGYPENMTAVTTVMADDPEGADVTLGSRGYRRRQVRRRGRHARVQGRPQLRDARRRGATRPIARCR